MKTKHMNPLDWYLLYVMALPMTLGKRSKWVWVRWMGKILTLPWVGTWIISMWPFLIMAIGEVVDSTVEDGK